MKAPHQEKTPPFDELRALVGAPGADIDLVEGALLVAQLEYPEIDRAVYRRQLEGMRSEAAEFRRGDTLDSRLCGPGGPDSQDQPLRQTATPSRSGTITGNSSREE